MLRLSQLKLQNFRSIKEETIVLHSCSVLIGHCQATQKRPTYNSKRRNGHFLVLSHSVKIKSTLERSEARMERDNQHLPGSTFDLVLESCERYWNALSHIPDAQELAVQLCKSKCSG